MYLKLILIPCLILILSQLAVSREKYLKPCDDDWIYLDDNCYWSSYQLVAKNASASPLANWFGAELYCLTLGANLAHFSNDFEKGLISSMVACSPSWLGLVLRVAPDKTAWVWWGSCEYAEHLVTKFEPHCGTHQPSVARLDPKGVVVGDYPDAKYPFVCKKFANPVDDDCDGSSTIATASVPDSTMVTTERMENHMENSITERTENHMENSVTESTENSVTEGMENSITEHVKNLRKFKNHVTEEVEVSTEMDFISDAMDYEGSGSGRTTVEESSAEPLKTTVTMTTNEPIDATTVECKKKKCFTGFLDDDNNECCRKRLSRRDAKRFYDEKTKKCYYVPLNLTSPVDYFSAQLECQEQHMHLSSIHSADENHVIGFLSMCRQMWIGLENVRPEDVCNCNGWAWEDYSSLTRGNNLCADFSHNFFNKNLTPLAPTCTSTAQCVYMHPQNVLHEGYQYYWKNCYCYDLQIFMCVDQDE